MADRHFVYSTASAPQRVVRWLKLENGMFKEDGYVLIHGGANIASGSTPKTHTPRGVVTEVNDEQLAILLNDYTFKRQMKAGFMKIETVEARPDKVAKDMTPRDESAPMTPETIAESVARSGGAPLSEETPRGLLDRLRDKVA